jgi:hypothetical protein
MIFFKEEQSSSQICSIHVFQKKGFHLKADGKQGSKTFRTWLLAHLFRFIYQLITAGAPPCIMMYHVLLKHVSKWEDG